MQTIDVDHPVRSIREASDMSLRQLGEALGKSYQSILNAERRGTHVELATLMQIVEAAGLRLEIRVGKVV